MFLIVSRTLSPEGKGSPLQEASSEIILPKKLKKKLT